MESSERDNSYEKKGYVQLADMIKGVEESIGTDENGETYVDVSDLLGASPAKEGKRSSYYDLVSYINNEMLQQPEAKRRIELIQQMRKHDVARQPGLETGKINPRELVLPTLSVHDQISELERIGEAIDEGVLDDKHKNVVVAEVYGLREVIGRDEPAANRGDDADRSATELRNRSLDGVIQRLERGRV